VVWIDVLPSDDAEQAGRATVLLDDPRVAHAHDPGQRSGRAFAEVLGVQDLAWDVYLLYEAGTTWRDPAPGPAAWFHQLGGELAEPSRRRSGHGLVVALHEAAREAGFPLPDAPPDEAAFVAAKDCAVSRLRAPDEPGGRCATCTAAGRLSSCSLGSWTRLLARDSGDGTVLVSEHEPASPPDGRRELRLRLTGLLCPECMLQAAAGPIAVNGVEEVEVLLDRAAMRVLLEPGSDVEVAEVVAAVRAQGFGVEADTD
jgi:hypothetical protein